MEKNILITRIKLIFNVLDILKRKNIFIVFDVIKY